MPHQCRWQDPESAFIPDGFSILVEKIALLSDFFSGLWDPPSQLLVMGGNTSGSQSLVEFPALLLSQGCTAWQKDKLCTIHYLWKHSVLECEKTGSGFVYFIFKH